MVGVGGTGTGALAAGGRSHLSKPQPLKISLLPPTMTARMHVISGAEGLSQPSRFLYLMASLREAHSMNHHESPSSRCSHCVCSILSKRWMSTS